eukprot:947164-Pleurochrysis_carterae.AAC.1
MHHDVAGALRPGEAVRLRSGGVAPDGGWGLVLPAHVGVVCEADVQADAAADATKHNDSADNAAKNAVNRVSNGASTGSGVVMNASEGRLLVDFPCHAEWLGDASALELCGSVPANAAEAGGTQRWVQWPKLKDELDAALDSRRDSRLGR